MRYIMFFATLAFVFVAATVTYAQALPPSPQRMDAALTTFDDILKPLKASMPSEAEAQAVAQDYAQKAEELRAQAMAGAAVDSTMNLLMTQGAMFLPPQAQMALGLLQALSSMIGLNGSSFTKGAVESLKSDLESSHFQAGAQQGLDILTKRGFTPESFGATLGYVFAGYWQQQGGIPPRPDLGDEGIPQSPLDVMMSAVENNYISQGQAPPSQDVLRTQAQSLLPHAARDVVPFQGRIRALLSDME